MNCYLCSSAKFAERKGKARDNPDLKILECLSCGLVTLSSIEHITKKYYENSESNKAWMKFLQKGDPLQSIEDWLAESYELDKHRSEKYHNLIENKMVLDFGCGNGGFLLQAKTFASGAVGIDLEKRVQEYWKEQIKIYSSIGNGCGKYDLITAFHVIEHIPDPIKILKELSEYLTMNGKIIIEVPNSEDALLTLYDCDAFQKYTYWSEHLFLYNKKTLNILAEKSGLKTLSIDYDQRYPLSNHLYWLSHGQPGGHKEWESLNSLGLNDEYAKTLEKIGKSDTIIGIFEKEN